MAYIVILLITLGFLATGHWPALAAVYSEFIMGVLGAASIFTGANTAIKWMAHKAHVTKIGANGKATEEDDIEDDTDGIDQAPSPANLDPED